VATYAVLLRGINVGGKSKVAMADLRDLLGELGFTAVKTLLQSGNAVFDAPGEKSAERLKDRIEAALTKRYGRTIGCVIVTRAELDQVIAANPFAGVATNPSRLLVTFLSGPPDPARFAEDDPAAYAPDQIVLGKREIYTWHPNGQAETKLTPAFWAKRLPGLVATGRNWNTVGKLRDLLD
jgi:uncharacterized protein (DUF1697 family)